MLTFFFLNVLNNLTCVTYLFLFHEPHSLNAEIHIPTIGIRNLQQLFSCKLFSTIARFILPRNIKRLGKHQPSCRTAAMLGYKHILHYQIGC